MTQSSDHDAQAPISASDRALRLDASARTAGALAHEIANYLGAISTWVYILQEDLGQGPGARDELGFILESIESATRFIKELRAFAHPRTFGHSGVGTSYCWADPNSGVSFAFLSNCRRDNEWHNKRMDTLSTLVHASILE
jgi:CubicO group peptidase (beta-lactamase class C family)